MHYVIAGNGVAGITAALTIRQRDRSARITVISGESDYFFSRTALMYAYLDRMNRRDLEPFERKSYDAQRIERVKGWIRDLDASRKTVQLDDGKTLVYDKLLLATGSAPNRPTWPGLDVAQNGVVHFVSLQDLDACEALTPSTREAVVVGGGLIGVELVECLVHHGVKVTFLVREPWYWPAALAAEEGNMISDHIRSHGVHVQLEEEVAEVIVDGTGRVQSVRTKRGRDFPAQMLGIAIGVRPAIDWLKSVTSRPALGRGIQVTPDFRTSLEDVYAAGDCAEILLPNGSPAVEQIWYSAKRQGELAGLSMLGDRINYAPPIFYNSAKFFDVEYTTTGECSNLAATARSFYYRVPGKDISLRISEHNGAVIGFNMLGSRWNQTLFEQWIRERRSLQQVMAMLHTAQFDVEFGRLDLSGVRREFSIWNGANQ
jgi:NADPH-dependent 2,4-dienoyl-CoA reductase/sulfur reductase-like enzyme